MQTGDIANSITFLGTGGARIMAATQTLATGGLWFNLGGTQILVDPGPGCIVRSTKKGLKAENLSAVMLSHRHLDHSADTNVMTEAMVHSGFAKRGAFFAPSDALDSEPVLYSYLKKFIERIEIFSEGGEYSLEGIKISTPLRHVHPVETYGIRFETKDFSISYVSDTRYFEELAGSYKSDLLIINTVFLEPHPVVAHMSIKDAEKLISLIKPKMAILTHFGMQVWKAHPEKLASEITKRTAVKTIAAKDGMAFDLNQLKTLA